MTQNNSFSKTSHSSFSLSLECFKNVKKPSIKIKFCHLEPREIRECPKDKDHIKNILLDIGYKNVNYLGSGAFGVVFSASTDNSTSEIAIKLTFPENESELYQQITIARDLSSHQNERMRDIQQGAFLIHKKFMIDVGDSRYLYVIETSKGEEALNIITNSVFNYSDRKEYCYSLLQDLFCLHKLFKVHADIKTKNFLIFGTQANLIDYGEMFSIPFEYIMNERHKDSISYKGGLKGTRPYAAPELRPESEILWKSQTFEINYDPFKADVYSLGLVFLEILHIGNPNGVDVQAIIRERRNTNKDAEILALAKSYPVNFIRPHLYLKPGTLVQKVNILEHMLEPDPIKRWGLIKLLMRINMMQKLNNFILDKKKWDTRQVDHLQNSILVDKMKGVELKIDKFEIGRLSFCTLSNQHKSYLFKAHLNENNNPDGFGKLILSGTKDIKMFYKGEFWNGMLNGIGKVILKDKGSKSSKLVMEGFWNYNIYCESLENMILVEEPNSLKYYNAVYTQLHNFNRIYVYPCINIRNKKYFSERKQCQNDLMFFIWDSEAEFKFNLALLINEKAINELKINEIKFRRKRRENKEDLEATIVIKGVEIKKKIKFLHIIKKDGEPPDDELSLISIFCNQLTAILERQLKSINLKLSFKGPNKNINLEIIDNYIDNFSKISKYFNSLSINLKRTNFSQWGKYNFSQIPNLIEINICETDINNHIFKKEILEHGSINIFKKLKILNIQRIKCCKLIKISHPPLNEFLNIHLKTFKDKQKINKKLCLQALPDIEPILKSPLIDLCLQELSIKDCDFFFSRFRTLFQLPKSITKLNLSNTDVNNEFLYHWELDQLEVLKLKCCNKLSLKAIIDFSARSKNTLKVLDFSETEFKFRNAKEYSYHYYPKIEELYIANMSHSLEPEENWKFDFVISSKLRVLDISGSPISGHFFFQNMFRFMRDFKIDSSLRELYLNGCPLININTISLLLLEKNPIKDKLELLSLKNAELKLLNFISLCEEQWRLIKEPLALKKFIWIYKYKEKIDPKNTEEIIQCFNSILFNNLLSLEIEPQIALELSKFYGKLKLPLKINKIYPKIILNEDDFEYIDTCSQENTLWTMNDETAAVYIKEKIYDDIKYELLFGLDVTIPPPHWIIKFPKYFPSLKLMTIRGIRELKIDFIPKLLKTSLAETLEIIITGDCWLDNKCIDDEFLKANLDEYSKIFIKNISDDFAEKSQISNLKSNSSFWTSQGSQRSSCYIMIMDKSIKNLLKK